jgi:hypothetical protein
MADDLTSIHDVELPSLTREEQKAAMHQAALMKLARKQMPLPNFCVNCGQEVKGQIAADSAASDASYCPIHGVKLRPDKTCPLC